MQIETVPLTSLSTYPGNPRRGAIATIRESLETFGQYRPLVVQSGTDVILAGNQTFLAAQSLGWEAIDITRIQASDDLARRIVLADNRTSELGTFDNEDLLALLEDLPTLEGTGYDEADVDDLIAILEESLPPEPSTATTTVTVTEDPPNITHEPTLAERNEVYASRATRLIVLTCPANIHTWLVEGLSKIAAAYGNPTDLSNTDIVCALVAEKLGEAVPSAPGETDA